MANCRQHCGSSFTGRGWGKKKWDGSGGQSSQGLGRSVGGFGTKINAAVDPLGHPKAIILTSAQTFDGTQLENLLAMAEKESLQNAASPNVEYVIADKAYGSTENRKAITRRGLKACIPPKKNSKEKIDYDRHIYKERNVIERYFAKLKTNRRVMTRHDKLSENYLGFVWLASVKIMLA